MPDGQPKVQENDWPSFWTLCRICFEGDQVAKRQGVEDGEAIYRSRCADCQEGFNVRIPQGTPDEERAAFLAWGGGLWRIDG